MKNKIKKLSVTLKPKTDLTADAELAAGVRNGDMKCAAEIVKRFTPLLSIVSRNCFKR